jgi:uncharacterized protein
MAPAIGYATSDSGQLHPEMPAAEAVEIVLEQVDCPLRVERCLEGLKSEYVSLRTLQMSVGSPDVPARRYLESVRSVIEETGAAAISDSLGIRRSRHDGVELATAAPVPFSLGALEAVCRNIDFLQHCFSPAPFYLESMAPWFRFAGDMDEVEFLTRLLSRTGCGWLIDIGSVYANAMNFHVDPYDFLGRVMPDASRVQLRLRNCLFDSATGIHRPNASLPIADEVWRLYRFGIEQAGPKVDAVFVDRGAAKMPDSVLANEIRLARELAAQIVAEQALLQRAG